MNALNQKIVLMLFLAMSSMNVFAMKGVGFRTNVGFNNPANNQYRVDPLSQTNKTNSSAVEPLPKIELARQARPEQTRPNENQVAARNDLDINVNKTIDPTNLSTETSVQTAPATEFSLVSPTTKSSPKKKTMKPKKQQSEISMQRKPTARLSYELSLIQDKLATKNVQDYINKNNTELTTNFENVENAIINEIAPIYTIGLVNSRSDMTLNNFSKWSDSLFSNSNSGKININEMKLPTNWKEAIVNDATNLQNIVAGFDALNRPIQNPNGITINNYLSDSLMSSYIMTLKEKFPHASKTLLNQYLQLKYIELKNPSPTSNDVNIKDMVDVQLPKDTKLQDLSAADKIYSMLTGIESILTKNIAQNQKTAPDATYDYQLSILKSTGDAATQDIKSRLEPVGIAIHAGQEKVIAAADAVSEKIGIATTAVQEKVSAAADAVVNVADRVIVQPVTHTARAVSDITAKTITATSNYYQQAKNALELMQQKRAITADIQQYEPALKALMETAINNSANNEASVQAAIAYIKNIVSSPNPKLSPKTLKYLQSALRKLEPQKQTITSKAETFSANEQAQPGFNPRQDQLITSPTSETLLKEELEFNDIPAPEADVDPTQRKTLKRENSKKINNNKITKQEFANKIISIRNKKLALDAKKVAEKQNLLELEVVVTEVAVKTLNNIDSSPENINVAKTTVTTEIKKLKNDKTSWFHKFSFKKFNSWWSNFISKINRAVRKNKVSPGQPVSDLASNPNDVAPTDQ